MQKDKWGGWFIFILVLGLCAGVWAQDKNVSFPHKPDWMRNPALLEKGSNSPLTPDLWISQNAPKAHRVITGTGGISGQVTKAGVGGGIVNVRVTAEQLTCPYDDFTDTTGSDGSYTITGLPAGEYEVWTENDSIYLDVYYNDETEYTADTVVVLNSIVPNINFSLRVGGKITGTVTKSGELFGITTVYATDTISYIDYSGYAYIISGSGSYEIRQLPSGIYKVNTANYSYIDSFANEYYNDKPDWATANPVPVTEGATTSPIDFILDVGGKITGTITLPGAPEVDVGIYATNTATGDLKYGSAYNPSGNSADYEIVGLPTGTYKVNTSNSQGYLDEYYNNEPDETNADPVPVTKGSTTPNIDFTLTLGGIIKGTLYGSGPLEDILVFALSTNSSFLLEGIASSDPSGNYRLTGLRGGYYKILIYGDTTYVYEYRKNKTSFGNADSILVTVSDSVLNVNDTLDVGGSISGYVYGEGAVPISDADVTAFSVSEFWNLRGDYTSADGSYKIRGLRTGYYKVEASIECDDMWYDNKPIWDQPDSVLVTMPGEASGINFNFPSAVEDEETQTASKPAEFELSQNYPNPFNPGTQIEYTLQKRAQVNLEIYNLLGQKVKTLANEYQTPGSYHILWDGKNEQGKTIASGIYFYKLEVNGVSQTKRMVLLK